MVREVQLVFDYFEYPKTDLYSVFDTDQSRLDIILKLGITSSLSSPLPPVKPLPFLLFALSFSLLTTSSSTCAACTNNSEVSRVAAVANF